jgi:hypothetical protein
MTRKLIFFSVILLLAGCEQEEAKAQGGNQSKSVASWYSQWISEKHGEIFHSEISLNAGEVATVSISSETSLEVGYVVERGYEVSKDRGTIYIGTEEAPHAAGGSPGTWRKFDSVDGHINVRLENTSAISTKLAVYTKSNG